MLSLTYVITGLSFCRAQLRVQMQCSVSNAMFERDVVLTKRSQMVRSQNGSKMKKLEFFCLKKKKEK